MASIRIAIAALMLASGVAAAAAGETRAPQCTHSLAQYSEAIRHLEAQFARARALADTNPLYESDVGYYASVLADARECLRMGAPVTTAAR